MTAFGAQAQRNIFHLLRVSFMTKSFFKYFLIGLICIAGFNSQIICAQSALDSLNNGQVDSSAPELVTEKIRKISASKKIFILTNENASYNKGDFVSLLLNTNLIVRCVVAKTVEKEAGLKFLKIYNLDLWNTLRSGMAVQVLRGDDSYYKNKKDVIPGAETPGKIDTDEDLFNSTKLEEDGGELDENTKRHIRTDNIVTITYGQIEGVDNDGSAQKYGQPALQWAYQFADNFWGEVSYGQNVIKDFPSLGLDTKMTNLIFRAKYTIAAPFYSYFKPYVGYQMINSSSPGAGSETKPGEPTEDQRNKEIELVDKLKKNTIVAGVTVLKRLVPGWFARLDLGTDIMSFGFGLEF